MPDILISQFDRRFTQPIETNRLVSSLTVRDSIPVNVRWEGMIVYVITEGESYVLKGGVDNTNWELISGLADAPIDGSQYIRKDGAWEIFIPPAAALPYLLFEATIVTSPTTPTIDIHYDTTEGFTFTNPAVGVYTLTPVGTYNSTNTTLFANPVQVGSIEDEFVKLTKGGTSISVLFFKDGVLSDSGNRIDVQIKQFTP